MAVAVAAAAVQLHDGDGPLHGPRRIRLPLVVAQPCHDKGARNDEWDGGQNVGIE